MMPSKLLPTRFAILLAFAILLQPLFSAAPASADSPDHGSAANAALTSLGAGPPIAVPLATPTAVAKLVDTQTGSLTAASLGRQQIALPAANPAAKTALSPGALLFPQLLTTTVAIAPGGNVSVTGANLGATAGHLRLLFDLPGGSTDLHVMTWNDSAVVAGLPQDFAGFVDQKAHVKAVTAAGAETDLLDIQFVATRQTKKLDLTPATIACPSSTQFDDCRTGVNGLLFAVHVSDCCFNGVDGTDDYTMPALQNGWTVDHIDFANDQSEDDWYQSFCYRTDNPLVIPDAAGTATLIGRPQAGSASIDIKVAWHVNANCSPVDYKATIYVTGPTGVSEVWPVHPPSL